VTARANSNGGTERAHQRFFNGARSIGAAPGFVPRPRPVTGFDQERHPGQGHPTKSLARPAVKRGSASSSGSRARWHGRPRLAGLRAVARGERGGGAVQLEPFGVNLAGQTRHLAPAGSGARPGRWRRPQSSTRLGRSSGAPGREAVEPGKRIGVECEPKGWRGPRPPWQSQIGEATGSG